MLNPLFGLLDGELLTEIPTHLAKFSKIRSFFLGDDGKDNRALFKALPIDWVERNGVVPAAGRLVVAFSNFFFSR